MYQEIYDDLIKLAHSYEHAYWVENNPEVSDASFDKLVRGIKKIEEDHPDWVRPDSPTQRIGGEPIREFQSASHVCPMLSLENCFAVDELMTWIKKTEEAGATEWMVEPKVDGISVDLCYTKGILTQALTRGNGQTGDIVTHNVKTIRSVPLDLDSDIVPNTVHIRGEIYMEFEAFKVLNESRKQAGQTLLANPRNAAGGALKLLDPQECAQRPLTFVPYALAWWPATTRVSSQSEALDLFSSVFKFKKLPETYLCDSPDKVLDAIMRFEASKNHLPFPVDGAVIKINKYAVQVDIGVNNIGPQWARAFKYAAAQVETRLNSITFQVGKTGIIAPVAKLEPVEISGSIIARATLHNANEIAKKDIRIGDMVIVEKAGEVIPHVSGPIIEQRTGKEIVVKFPETCPSCNEKIFRDQTEDGEGAAWRCVNRSCPDQVKGKLLFWCSKGAMNIESVGPETVEKLYEIGIKHVYTFYDIRDTDILSIFGTLVSRKIVQQIAQSKSAGMERILVGLCIPRVGETYAKKLARMFPNLKTWAQSFDVSTKVESMEKEVGKATTLEMAKWLSVSSNWGLLEALTKKVDITSKTFNPNAADGPLKGKIFVITGTLSTLDRDVAHRMIEDKGGKATSAVSKKTSYLVVGNEPGNNKIEAAQKHGTTQLNEIEFVEMLNA